MSRVRVLLSIRRRWSGIRREFKRIRGCDQIEEFWGGGSDENGE